MTVDAYAISLLTKHKKNKRICELNIFLLSLQHGIQ